MSRFASFLRLTWSFLVVFVLAFSLAGCEGDDGAAGASGRSGTGPPDHWDLQDLRECPITLRQRLTRPARSPAGSVMTVSVTSTRRFTTSMSMPAPSR